MCPFFVHWLFPWTFSISLLMFFPNLRQGSATSRDFFALASRARILLRPGIWPEIAGNCRIKIPGSISFLVQDLIKKKKWHLTSQKNIDDIWCLMLMKSNYSNFKGMLVWISTVFNYVTIKNVELGKVIKV